jgi:rare lipoprotein A (peptidoglycan hydrolase)
MLGKHWRGQWVTVRSGAKSVTVHLTDWCLCSHGRRLIDLDNVAFSKLAPLGRGVIAVMIETVDASLPATDTAP